MWPTSGTTRTISRALAGVAGVFGLTHGCALLSLNATATSLSFLLLILIIASGWGLLPAIIASVTATVLLNFYFLPPVGTFTIADPQNWIALAAFLITAGIASELSNRAQKESAAANQQRLEVERLYELSRAVLLDTGEHGLGTAITRQIVGAFGFESVLFYELGSKKTYTSGLQEIPRAELENVKEPVVLKDGSQAVPVRLGNKSVGVLAIRGQVGKPALEAIANLVAIIVERAASQEMASRATAARISEELKSSILDALAHEFKTPLTSIKAASTTLLAKGSTPSDSQRELFTIIDEEADRLTRLVNEAIQAARIEAGRVKLTRIPTEVSDLTHRAVEHMRGRLDERGMELDIPDRLSKITVDPELMELAVRQLIDNAVKYSHPGTPIVIRAKETPHAIQLSISDSGPGLSEREQQKVFEKFYRGEAVRNKVPGTGMGLNIVKDIVHAHSGAIWVQSTPNVGSTFVIELPAAQETGG